MSEMQRTESSVRLSTYHSGVFDGEDREYVIVPGYHADGWFGYFICKEIVVTNVNKHDTIYLYRDVQCFVRKTNEGAYQRALDLMKQHLTAQEKD